MNDIICPNCHKAFKVDETGFAEIIKQVHNDQFEKELKSKLDSEIKLAEAKTREVLQKELVRKDTEIAKNSSEAEKLLSNKELEINKLRSDVTNLQEQKKRDIELTEANVKNSLQTALSEKDLEINKLKLDLNYLEKQKEQEIQLIKSQVTGNLEKEKSSLELKIAQSEKQFQLDKQKIAIEYDAELKNKDYIIKSQNEEIERQKDLKLKLSTKMLGESLEQHCENEFSKIRPTSFPRCYFEKDNDSKGGTKGDYIFRDYDELGNELISIMFEMKNEADDTIVKKKNTDFLQKLDKDRNEKQCEYAILVSLLETDNEFYNTGIVDLSYKYPKMYVIRPQYFIQIIGLLRNAGLNAVKYKQELLLIKNQDIDITNFQDKIDTFKEGFFRNNDLASKHFTTAIDSIDKAIKQLNNVKDSLNSSQDNLRRAGEKLDDLTIKKLIRNNPTMKEKFSKLEQDKEEIS